MTTFSESCCGLVRHNAGLVPEDGGGSIDKREFFDICAVIQCASAEPAGTPRAKRVAPSTPLEHTGCARFTRIHTRTSVRVHERTCDSICSNLAWEYRPVSVAAGK